MAPSKVRIWQLPSVAVTFACALQLALAAPEAQPEPEPWPAPEPIPQGNVYQYSGAIYILGGNGDWCPANAPQSCGGIPWCCAAGCSCQQLNNGVVGCCPYGGTCSGPAPAVISTVTVYQSYPVTTTVQGQPTTAPVTTVTGPTAVVVAGATTTTTSTSSTTTPTPVIAGGQYCSTLYAKGPNLPTTAAGQCGTILVVNNARSMLEGSWVGVCALSGIWGAMALLRLGR